MARELLDLIKSGGLPLGTELVHPARIHAERAVEARIVPGGIDVAGSVFASPSGAARAVAKTKAENGWTWWRVRSDGRTLAEWRKGA